MTGCILYSVALFSPVLALPATLFFSLPTAFLAYEYGALCALSSAVFSSAAMGFTVSGVYGLMHFVTFGFAGAMIGLTAKSDVKGGNLLIVSSTMEFLGGLAGVLIFHYFFGLNFLAPEASEIDKSIISYGVAPLDRETTRMVVDRIVLLAPYGLIFFSVLEAQFCLILLSRIHGRRTGETVYSTPPFRNWRFPKSVLLALAVGFICGRISLGREGLYLLKQMGANLSEISRTIFIFQGLSCGYFFMEKKGMPMLFRIIAICLTLLVSFFGDVFAIIGVLDMGLNFRERQERA
jgi:uncharacterized protein YybS (DUF2232 family)